MIYKYYIYIFTYLLLYLSDTLLAQPLPYLPCTITMIPYHQPSPTSSPPKLALTVVTRATFLKHKATPKNNIALGFVSDPSPYPHPLLHFTHLALFSIIALVNT